MNRITTVTMNPCIDRTIQLDGFVYAGTNHVVATRVIKGLNISLALKALGIGSMAVSFDFLENAGMQRAGGKDCYLQTRMCGREKGDAA